MKRCETCGHPLAAHDPQSGCTERVPGTKERMPGACGCGSPPVLADILPFRSRSEREAGLQSLVEQPPNER